MIFKGFIGLGDNLQLPSLTKKARKEIPIPLQFPVNLPNRLTTLGSRSASLPSRTE